MKTITIILLGVLSMSAEASNKILKFTARWCPPCQQMKPIVAAASEKTGVEVVDVDIDVDKTAPDKYRVRGIPTLILEKDGREVERVVGVQSEEKLIEIINKSFGLTK